MEALKFNDLLPAAGPEPDPQRRKRPDSARARQAWLLVAMAVPITVMLALHHLARTFQVPGDSPLAWAGVVCAALVMAGGVALIQARTDRPPRRRAGRRR
ncbi:hypothetical protein [Massilia sp. BSC265]|uniref:hypothetical protein n=1 Tax=Massilia sp. BSC265 TaxID=1549812 RepID=UPI0004E97C4F|nr:hypothetical protein [Massilia sp. BSC265]KFI09082.1 hypothetical protein JN27_00075 [Massilia sp. BSC265]